MTARNGIVMVVAALVLLGAALYFLPGAGPPAAAPVPAAALVPAPAPDGAPPVVETPGAPAVPAAATAAGPAGDFSSPAAQSLQRRLDAMATAYNDGDARAMEAALWENHAVIRPTGRTLYRSDLLGQWAREWAGLSNRNLSFTLEEVREEGSTVHAMWALSLTAEVFGEDGATHAYRFDGTQRATILRDGDREVLAGPIAYARFDSELDGYPWVPPEE